VPPTPYRFGKRFPEETDAFFAHWAEGFPASQSRRYAFLQSAFELRLQARDARAVARRVHAGARIELTSDTTVADRVRWLVDAFNELRVTYPPDERERGQLHRIAGIAAASREVLAPPDDILALRLLGCVAYYLGLVAESDLYFARSAVLARREGRANQEIATLLGWRGFWKSRFADGLFSSGFASDEAIAFSAGGELPVVSDMGLCVAGTGEHRPFPSYPEEEVNRRIAELEEEIGYMPLVARKELRTPLLVFLEDYGDASTTSWRGSAACAGTRSTWVTCTARRSARCGSLT
jgi:hypothetical protein